MFLPCLSTTTNLPVAPSLHGSNQALLRIAQRLPYKFRVESGEPKESDKQPDVTVIPWDNINIHPLLEEFSLINVHTIALENTRGLI